MDEYVRLPEDHPESYHSSMSGPLNSLLKTKLREHALILRKLSSSLRATSQSPDASLATLRAKKEELMKEVYTIMSATRGLPPLPAADGKQEPFVWEFYDKDGKPGCWEGTPKEFYAIAKGDYEPKECFSLIHDPRNDFGKLYTVDKLGNIWGARPVLCTYYTDCPYRFTLYSWKRRCEHEGRRPQAGRREDDQGRHSRVLWM